MATTGSAAGNPNQIRTTAIVIFLATVLALWIAFDRLGHPYHEIGHFFGYVLMFGVVVYRLRACYRVASTPEQKGKLAMVSTFLAITAIGDLANLNIIFRSGDPNLIRALTRIGLLMALYFALELVEMVLKKPAGVPPDGGWDRVSPPSE